MQWYLWQIQWYLWQIQWYLGENTVVIGSKNSDILGTQWLFGKFSGIWGQIQQYLVKQWYLWEIQRYLRQRQCYGGKYSGNLEQKQ